MSALVSLSSFRILSRLLYAMLHLTPFVDGGSV